MLILENKHFDDISIKWEEICNQFRSEFGEKTYNGWIYNLNLVSLNSSEIVMSVPTTFIKDWISREYLNGKFKIIDGNRVCIKKGIKQILLDFFPKLMSFQIIVDKDKKEIQEEKVNNISDNVKSISPNDNIYNIGIPLNANYTFDNYVVGTSNKLAYQVAKSIATEDGVDMNTNPLFIYGGVGLGKTHLCQAIAWKIKEIQPTKRVVYLSAEKFMFLFVQSIQEQSMNDFKNKFRNIDVLIIDDIQFIIGKDKTQNEFFYTFETLINNNKQIILACDRSPINLIDLDEKLKSRLNGGLIADIKEPDYQLRLDIIKRKSTILGLNIDNKLMEYIASKIVSSGREIEGCLKRLTVHQNIMDIKITKKEVENILADNIIASQKIITINSIQETVAKFYNISISDLKSVKRLKNLVIPRHVAMYLCKKLTEKSFPDIARSFNGKNHATIIHAVKKIEETIEKDQEIARNVSEIENLLKN